MGRPSLREERRAEILSAFARVLARHGVARATIAAVASEAGVAPGLIHHHFVDKDDLLRSLLAQLVQGFRERTQARADVGDDKLRAYVDAALKLDERADVVSAKCWVSLLAEAVSNPALHEPVRRLIDTEIAAIRSRSHGKLTDHAAGAVLAYVIGALVLGAFAPRKTAGFAAPGLHRLVAALLDRGR